MQMRRLVVIGILLTLGGGELWGRCAGLAGIDISDVELKGIVKGRSTRSAMLLASKGQAPVSTPDGPCGGEKLYVARLGDKLFDGEVIRIDRNRVVFRRRVQNGQEQQTE